MISGASPADVEPGNEAEVSRNIRGMFGRIAPRYDLLNRLLSMRTDQYWRRSVVRRVHEYLERPESRILDLCCGTADLLIEIESERHRLDLANPHKAIGADFCHPMLVAARQKLAQRKLASPLIEADALDFPGADGSVDLITIAYGFRNLANYRRGLGSMFRLLAPGGCLAILEFSRPTNRLWGRMFEFYFRNILPRVGNAISGSGNAYSYLQQSVEKFPSPEELTSSMRACGFQRVEMTPLTGGISALYLAYK